MQYFKIYYANCAYLYPRNRYIPIAFVRPMSMRSFFCRQLWLGHTFIMKLGTLQNLSNHFRPSHLLAIRENGRGNTESHCNHKHVLRKMTLCLSLEIIFICSGKMWLDWVDIGLR